MKIAYVCSSLSLGGLELNHLRNAHWMQERGHEVAIFSPKDSPLFKQAINDGMTCYPISHQRKYYAWGAALRLFRTLRRNKFTHVFIRDNRDMSLCATVKCLSGKKLSLAYFMEMQLGVKKKGVLHTLRFSYLNYWFCPLPYLEQQVLEWTNINPEKVHLLPSGINRTNIKLMPREEARKQLALPAREFTFGLVGRFDRQKGQLLVLEAMELCKHRAFNVVFLGEPTRNEQHGVVEAMEEFIAAKNLEQRVFIRPFMPELSTFYASIDALIMATKAETFGMVTLEAITYGVPVVGSRAGGTPDLLQNENFGYCFEPLVAASLAEAMDKMIDQPLVFNTKTWEAHLARFDYQAVCKSIEQVVT
jgi:glycosyltransferase involved in cell wall biosynthesis